MNEISHKQARSLIQHGALRPAEQKALEQHLARCDRCHHYAAVNVYLSENLPLDVDVPQLSREQRRALAARMEQQVRREQMMSQMTSVVRPVAWSALFAVVIVVAAGIFSIMRQPVAEPAAVGVVAGSAPQAVATPTIEPTLARYEIDDASIALLDGSASAVINGQQETAVEVMIEWSWRGESVPLSSFIHLLDEQGTLVSQVDVALSPEAGTDKLSSHARLELPAGVGIGTVDVWIGLYEEATGERLPTISGETMVLLDTVAFDSEVENAPAETAATPFPPTAQAPSGAASDAEYELRSVALSGVDAHTHPQVSGRFSLGVDEAQESAPFPLWLPSRLPAGIAFIGAEVNNGQATLIFGPENEERGMLLTLEQRLGQPFQPGPDQEAGRVTTVPLAEGEALYYDNAIMSALAWQEGDMAFEWTVTPGELPLETLRELAMSLVVGE